MRRKPKFDEAAMDAAERHYCKAAALVAGVDKILNFVGNESWGTDITIDISIQLLEEAKAEREAGQQMYRKSETGRR